MSKIFTTFVFLSFSFVSLFSTHFVLNIALQMDEAIVILTRNKQFRKILLTTITMQKQ